MESQREKIEQLQNLALYALENLRASNQPVLQICGPISSGGFGSVKENIEYLQSVIYEVQRAGFSVFDQLEYERDLDWIMGPSTDDDHMILEYFYDPILRSGYISGLVFVPLWETSVGCLWENKLGMSLNLPILYLSSLLVSDVNEFVQRYVKTVESKPSNLERVLE